MLAPSVQNCSDVNGTSKLIRIVGMHNGCCNSTAPLAPTSRKVLGFVNEAASGFKFTDGELLESQKVLEGVTSLRLRLFRSRSANSPQME